MTANKFIDYISVLGIDDAAILDRIDPAKSGSVSVADLKKINFSTSVSVTQRYPSADQADFPFPSSLAMFCVPFGWKLRRLDAAGDNKPPPFSSVPLFFTNAMTDVNGNFSYVSTILFYSRVPGADDAWFKPNCVCIISRNPYFECFRVCLGKIYIMLLNRSSSNVDERDKNYSNYLVEKFIMQMFAINDSLNSKFTSLKNRSHDDKKLELFVQLRLDDSARLNLKLDITPDIPSTFNYVYLLVNLIGINNTVILFTGILLDSKILFVSSSYNLLYKACHALVSLIYPVKYNFVFIPQLPESLSDVLSAPTPFIIGVSTSYYKSLDLGSANVEDVIVANLDIGMVKTTATKLARLPDYVFEELSTNLTHILFKEIYTSDYIHPVVFNVDKYHHDGTDAAGKPPVNLSSYYPQATNSLNYQCMIDKKIRAAFFYAMNQLLDQYLACTTLIRINPSCLSHFDADIFLERRRFYNEEFIKLFIKTTIFNTFISSRSIPYRSVDLFDFIQKLDLVKFMKTVFDNCTPKFIDVIGKYLMLADNLNNSCSDTDFSLASFNNFNTFSFFEGDRKREHVLFHSNSLNKEINLNNFFRDTELYQMNTNFVEVNEANSIFDITYMERTISEHRNSIKFNKAKKASLVKLHSSVDKLSNIANNMFDSISLKQLMELTGNFETVKTDNEALAMLLFTESYNITKQSHIITLNKEQLQYGCVYELTRIDAKVIMEFIEYLFDLRLLYKCRQMIPHMYSLCSLPAARLLICIQLNKFVEKNCTSLVDNQFNLLSQLLNYIIKRERGYTGFSIAFLVVELASRFCRRIPHTNKSQYMYMTLQDHPLWKIHKFWENVFYCRVQSEIVQFYRTDSNLEKIGCLFDEGEHSQYIKYVDQNIDLIEVIYRGSGENEFEQLPVYHPYYDVIKLSKVIVADHLKKKEMTLIADESQLISKLEEGLIYSLASHFITKILTMQFNVKYNASVAASVNSKINMTSAELKASFQSISEMPDHVLSRSLARRENESNNLISQTANTLAVPGGQHQTGNDMNNNTTNNINNNNNLSGDSSAEKKMELFRGFESIKKFILNFINNVANKVDFKFERVTSLQSLLPELAKLHYDTCQPYSQERENRLSFDPCVLKLADIHLTLNEKVVTAVECLCLPDGVTHSLQDITLTCPGYLPALGVLYATNYRLVFKGVSINFFCNNNPVYVSIPYGLILKYKFSSNNKNVLPQLYVSLIDVENFLSLRLKTAHIVNFCFDKEIGRYVSETSDNFFKSFKQIFASFLLNVNRFNVFLLDEDGEAQNNLTGGGGNDNNNNNSAANFHGKDDNGGSGTRLNTMASHVLISTTASMKKAKKYQTMKKASQQQLSDSDKNVRMSTGVDTILARGSKNDHSSSSQQTTVSSSLMDAKFSDEKILKNINQHNNNNNNSSPTNNLDTVSISTMGTIGTIKTNSESNKNKFSEKFKKATTKGFKKLLSAVTSANEIDKEKKDDRRTKLKIKQLQIEFVVLYQVVQNSYFYFKELFFNRLFSCIGYKLSYLQDYARFGIGMMGFTLDIDLTENNITNSNLIESVKFVSSLSGGKPNKGDDVSILLKEQEGDKKLDSSNIFVKSSWRVSSINLTESNLLFPGLPQMIVVPFSSQDGQLPKVAKSFRLKRFPVLSWLQLKKEYVVENGGGNKEKSSKNVYSAGAVLRASSLIKSLNSLTIGVKSTNNSGTNASMNDAEIYILSLLYSSLSVRKIDPFNFHSRTLGLGYGFDKSNASADVGEQTDFDAYSSFKKTFKPLGGGSGGSMVINDRRMSYGGKKLKTMKKNQAASSAAPNNVTLNVGESANADGSDMNTSRTVNIGDVTYLGLTTNTNEKITLCSDSFLPDNVQNKPTIVFIFGDKTYPKGCSDDSTITFVQMDNYLPDASQLKAGFEKLTKVMFSNDNLNETVFSVGSYYKTLTASNWLNMLSQLLQVASTIAFLSESYESYVIVGYGEGSEVNAQLCSLVQLMLDPFYRTVTGFQVLVDKEWLAFKHRFAYRNGVSGSTVNTAVNSSAYVPYFLQFLDCVHNLLLQYPTSFEFNDNFLSYIGYHCLTNKFDTFSLLNDDDSILLSFCLKKEILLGGGGGNNYSSHEPSNVVVPPKKEASITEQQQRVSTTKEEFFSFSDGTNEADITTNTVAGGGGTTTGPTTSHNNNSMWSFIKNNSLYMVNFYNSKYEGSEREEHRVIYASWHLSQLRLWSFFYEDILSVDGNMFYELTAEDDYKSILTRCDFYAAANQNKFVFCDDYSDFGYQPVSRLTKLDKLNKTMIDNDVNQIDAAKVNKKLESFESGGKKVQIKFFKKTRLKTSATSTNYVNLTSTTGPDDKIAIDKEEMTDLATGRLRKKKVMTSDGMEEVSEFEKVEALCSTTTYDIIRHKNSFSVLFNKNKSHKKHNYMNDNNYKQIVHKLQEDMLFDLTKIMLCDHCGKSIPLKGVFMSCEYCRMYFHAKCVKNMPMECQMGKYDEERKSGFSHSRKNSGEKSSKHMSMKSDKPKLAEKNSGEKKSPEKLKASVIVTRGCKEADYNRTSDSDVGQGGSNLKKTRTEYAPTSLASKASQSSALDGGTGKTRRKTTDAVDMLKSHFALIEKGEKNDKEVFILDSKTRAIHSSSKMKISLKDVAQVEEAPDNEALVEPGARNAFVLVLKNGRRLVFEGATEQIRTAWIDKIAKHLL